MRGYGGTKSNVLDRPEQLRRYLRVKRFQDVVLSLLALRW